MEYVVRKPFSFNGRHYKAGEVFSQSANKATDKKMRALVHARYICLCESGSRTAPSAVVVPPPAQQPQISAAAEVVNSEVVESVPVTVEAAVVVEPTTKLNATPQEPVVDTPVGEIPPKTPRASSSTRRRRP